jgi:uncharacterized membrane protein YdjX (TVP38/TMEM64 family)
LPLATTKTIISKIRHVVLMALRTMLNLRVAFMCIWIIAILAAIMYVGPQNLLNDYSKVTPKGIKAVVLSYGAISIVIYEILHAMRPFTFLPVTPFTIAGGYIYGHILGLLLATMGTTLAAVVTFAMSRYLFRDYLRKRLSTHYAGFDHRFDSGGIFTVAALRVIPVLPFDAVGYVAGVSSIRFRDYIIGTLIGELPGAFVLTMLGSRLGDMRSPWFLVSLVLAAVLFLVPEIYRRMSRKPWN